MKYLLTGGAGFIGGHTCEYLLKRGDDVTVIDNVNSYYNPAQKRETLVILHNVASQPGSGRFVFHEVDLLEMTRVAEIYDSCNPDVLIHLAAQAGVRYSIDHSVENIQINITATTGLLELARKHKTSNVVMASSSSVYGKDSIAPFSEGQRCDQPISPYAATKRACELLAHTFGHLYNLNITMLRFFTVYGPRGRPDMAAYKFIDRAYKGLPIDKYGDGSAVREFTYIDDIVNGVISACDNPHKFLIVNLGGGATHTLNDLIACIETTTERKIIINQMDDQPGDVPLTSACQIIAKRELGFEPKISMAEGIKRTVEWYQSCRLPPATAEGGETKPNDAIASSPTSIDSLVQSGIQSPDRFGTDSVTA